MNRTVYRRNDAFAVEASAEGVRILFKRRVALPLLPPNAARHLAKMIVMASSEAEKLHRLESLE